ncbi:GntR family transcriptional regulator [Oscillospiraceae bacterium MB08-C2-2]|nr:GntR family transcriptional regulator [Oscillospiraceae bacterium MB08-C2-2]
MQTDAKRYLYEIVYTTLKEEILEGIYPFDVFLPPERDISVRFSVDRATARKSLALLVKDGLVEKRAGAGTKVVYRKDLPPSESSCGDLIGFFIIEEGSVSKKITQPFYSDLFFQVEKECRKFDANIIYSTLYNENDYLSILSQHHFTGIIFASKTDKFYIEAAENLGIKVAQIPGYSSRGLSVCYDNVAAGTHAVNHLIAKGHTKISLITGPRDYQTSRDRLAGALAALFQHGLCVPEEYVLEGDWEYESGYSIANTLLGMGHERPTSIYVFNDMMALGVIDAINEAGLNIPEDISIIGSDNMSDIRRREQKLTTTDGNVDMIAQIVLDYFFNSNLESMKGIKIIVPAALVEGDTVRDLYQTR